MLCILRGIINEVPFNVFYFDSWNTINQIFFKGIINKMSLGYFLLLPGIVPISKTRCGS